MNLNLALQKSYTKCFKNRRQFKLEITFPYLTENHQMFGIYYENRRMGFIHLWSGER